MSPLLRALIHRLLASIVVLIGVSMLMFAIARVIPGDPARIALGPNATEAQVQALRRERPGQSTETSRDKRATS